MPIYEYIDRDGSVKEVLVSSIKNRDAIQGRTSVPSRVCVRVGGGNRNRPLKEDVKRGYHQLEQRSGSRWPSTFSKQQIKRAWGL